VILWGVGGAVMLRVLFSLIATQLLAIVGLALAGGILLLWVCWKMYRDMIAHQPEPAFAGNAGAGGVDEVGARTVTFSAALIQIVVADASMSLDNVLAVAGAAREHPIILIFGLGLSIALMGFAANFMARVLQKHRWVAYVGLLIILYVAFDMCYRGALEVWRDANV
jgi:YjbE family integral membrane protein